MYVLCVLISYMQVWIAWFGDGATVSMVDVACIKPLEEGIETTYFNKKFKKSRKSMPKKLEKAIKQARCCLKRIQNEKN